MIRWLPLGLLLSGCRVVVEKDRDDPDDTGPPGDSHEADDSGAPTTGPEGCAAPEDVDESELPEEFETSGGANYRVVRVASDELERVFLLVYYPQDEYPNGYEEGAPVIVTAHPSGKPDDRWSTAPRTYIPQEWGTVEVQPVYPGWDVQGYETSGGQDSGGPLAAITVRDAIRFAAGDILTWDGLTLAQVAGRTACNGRVVVLGSSAGGSTAALALATYADTLAGDVMGLALYESPTIPELVNAEAGAIWMDPDATVDADGDGNTWDDGRNAAFADCDHQGCAGDYAKLAWDPDASLYKIWPTAVMDPVPNGVLYLDGNGDGRLSLNSDAQPDVDGNGAIDADEDFVLPGRPETVDDPERVFYSPALTEAAAALFGDTWPDGVVGLDEATVYWEPRTLLNYLDATAAAWPPPFRYGVLFTERDHSVGLPNRPHVSLTYETLRTAGADVRYNASLDVARCWLPEDTIVGWSGGPEAGAEVTEDELLSYAFPEDAVDVRSRAVGVLNLIWETWGAFDHCPMDDETGDDETGDDDAG